MPEFLRSKLAIVTGIAVIGAVAGAIMVARSDEGAPPVKTSSSPASSASPEPSGTVPAGTFGVLPGSLTFDGTSSVARLKLVNDTSRAVAWRASARDPWLSAAPAAGSLTAGSTVVITVNFDPSTLALGAYRSVLDVSDGSKRVAVPVGATVRAVPVLQLPKTLLDFGRHRKGQTVRSFQIRNVGKQPLTYDVLNDRFYVYLKDDATGTVQPGASATVTVTFDHDRSHYGERDFPLQVATNGGSGEVRVVGITDTVGPRAHDENMNASFEDAQRRIHRWARADLRDEFGTIASGRVQYRICTGNPPAAPACEPWTLSEMSHFEGAIWQADVGPLPSCTGATGVYVNWRIQAEDDLVNHQFNPGSSTFYNFRHCAPPG